MGLEKIYCGNRKKYIVLSLVLLAALFVAAISAVAMGAMDIRFSDVLQVLLGKITNNASYLEGLKANVVAVVWEIRLPRIFCGVFVGMGLAVAGVIFQAVLQNPLADPYTIGISTGAAFGASLALFLNGIYQINMPVTFTALVFAMTAMGLVIFIAGRGGGFVTANLIIAGIIVSAVLSSGISLLKMLANENVGAIVYWIMGSLNAKSWHDFIVVAPAVSICMLLAFLFSEELNIIALGDQEAQGLGVNAKKMRLFFLILGSVITAACVSICGVIGFVGLIVPHLLRFWLTSDNKILIPLSAILGAVLLCTADNGARLLWKGEIPVGILTTLLGGPFFIFIFIKRQGERL